MDGFIFITDLHITANCAVRTGDVLDDVCKKIEHVVEYANLVGLPIVIGGDVFDKPTVPDFVKAAAARVFRRAEKPIYAISGNHDTLYNNDEFNVRTSYNLFVETGLFTDFTGKTIDLGEYVLTNELPLVTNGKPTVCVYHGFWNVDDGRWNCKTTDVVGTEDEVLVLLGHDHTVYEDEMPRGNVRVVRPGSLLRGIRVDEQNRTPSMVVCSLNGEKWVAERAPIQCRAASEIFTAKRFELKPTEVRDSYEGIIGRLKEAKSGEMTLEDALKEVTEQDVIDYINLCLGE